MVARLKSLAGISNHTITRWDRRTGQLIENPIPIESKGSSLSYTPQGEELFCSTKNGNLLIYSVPNDQPSQLMQTQTVKQPHYESNAEVLQFTSHSPNNKVNLLVGLNNGAFLYYNLPHLKPHLTRPKHLNNDIGFEL